MGVMYSGARSDSGTRREREARYSVPGTGAVRITHAPLGRSAETWAQKRGDIEFKSMRGITGTLHLKDDTVTLDR